MDNATEVQGTPVSSDETKAILDSLREEGYVPEGEQEPAAEEPAAEEPVVEADPVEPSQEPETPVEEPQVVDRAPKEPALMPAWEHKVAEKKWEKEKETLLAQIEAAQANPTQANRQAVTEAASNLRDLAQANGLELDEKQEAFFSALLQQAVPQDLAKRVEAYETQQQIAYLESQYNNEWSKDVEPLIKEKFGEVSASKLAELKKSLHDLAFSETYAKVPLRKIFAAEQDTFKLEHAEKGSIQAPKSGKSRTADVNYDQMTETDVEKMTPEEFERYSTHLQGGTGRWR